MKYRRLKSIDGSGTIMRYYELEDGEKAFANAFYEIRGSGKAAKIVGTIGDSTELIGFSHGGDNLAKGLLFLDINPSIVYMGILEEGDEERPKIGNVVNGYQKVIDTHYDGDEGVSGKGTNPKEWGIEDLDNPYYLFTIVQPAGTTFDDEISDSDAGESSGESFPAEEKNVGVISVVSEDGTGTLKYKVTEDDEEQEVTLTEGGATFTTLEVAKAGDTLGTVYYEIAMYTENGESLVVDLKNYPISGTTQILVAVPTVTP